VKGGTSGIKSGGRTFGFSQSYLCGCCESRNVPSNNLMSQKNPEMARDDRFLVPGFPGARTVKHLLLLFVCIVLVMLLRFKAI